MDLSIIFIYTNINLKVEHHFVHSLVQLHFMKPYVIYPKNFYEFCLILGLNYLTLMFLGLTQATPIWFQYRSSSFMYSWKYDQFSQIMDVIRHEKLIRMKVHACQKELQIACLQKLSRSYPSGFVDILGISKQWKDHDKRTSFFFFFWFKGN